MWNQLKTGILLALLTAIIIIIGSFIGTIGLVIAIVLTLAMNVTAYFYSDKIVLARYRAQKTTPSSHPELHKMVAKISRKAGIPKPPIYVIPESGPNAFATGRNPEHSAVAFTQGILDLLDKKELEGVAAHEIAHIKNRDTLVSTVAAVIAGAIGSIAFIAQWTSIFGGGDDDNNIIGLLVAAIVAPIAATIIQLAVSRTREYQADKTSSQYTGEPEHLASALLKLEKGNRVHPIKADNATAPLFISNPLGRSNFSTLFSTHPPTEKRVEKLRTY